MPRVVAIGRVRAVDGVAEHDDQMDARHEVPRERERVGEAGVARRLLEGRDARAGLVARHRREAPEVIAPRRLERGRVRAVAGELVEVVDLAPVGGGAVAAPERRVAAQPVAQRARRRLLRADDEERRQAAQGLFRVGAAGEEAEGGPGDARAAAAGDARARVDGRGRRAFGAAVEHEPSRARGPVLGRRRVAAGDARQAHAGR